MNPGRFIILAMGLSSLFAVAPSFAQTVINSVPYTISVSGKYVLGNNLIATASASQTAITVNAPNVILDLNQFFVSGPGNTPSSTQDVIRVAGVANVTIRNGTVANNGFGISFTASSSIDQPPESRTCESPAATCPASASTPLPAGSLVRDNVITEIGGTTNGLNQNGIITGGGVRIENNIIRMLTVSSTTGIATSNANDDFVIRNTVSLAGIGIRHGICQNNLTSSCVISFTDAVDAGGNR